MACKRHSHSPLFIFSPTLYSLVLLYVLDASPLVTKALSRVVPTEALDESVGRPCNVSRELHGVNALENGIVGLHGVRPSEGRGAW